MIENVKTEQFKNAMQALHVTPPLVERALSSLLEIKGLGISYASKHLRFLRPDLCPILDNVVWETFKYPWDPRGYRLLVSDVILAAKVLEENQIRNPISRPDGKWYAADVDMAVFACLQVRVQARGWV